MKNYFKLSFLVLFALIAFDCTKDDNLGGGGGGGDLDDIFIPDFSNQWTIVKGNYSGFVFFQEPTNVDSTKGTGQLVGTLEGSDDLAISASFANIKLKMTISLDSNNVGNAPLADSSFTGVFDTLANPHVIRLINIVAPFDSLVIVQG